MKVPKKAIKAVKPHLRHSCEEWKKIWWMEEYDQTLKFVYELFFEKQTSNLIRGLCPSTKVTFSQMKLCTQKRHFYNYSTFTEFTCDIYITHNPIIIMS